MEKPHQQNPARYTRCSHCNGTAKRRCTNCNGMGEILVYPASATWPFETWKSCNKCDQGYASCEHCNGTGSLIKERVKRWEEFSIYRHSFSANMNSKNYSGAQRDLSILKERLPEYKCRWYYYQAVLDGFMGSYRSALRNIQESYSYVDNWSFDDNILIRSKKTSAARASILAEMAYIQYKLKDIDSASRNIIRAIVLEPNNSDFIYIQTAIREARKGG